MAKLSYNEPDLYSVDIDTTEGTVILGGEEYIINNKREAIVFKTAYEMGREHKKSQINKILGL